MRLTHHTDYALRTMIYVGINQGRLSTIPEIAKHYGISRNHLMKIVHELGKAGFLETVRGRGGGIRLGCNPTKVTVGEIVRITEIDLNIVECFDSTRNQCQITSACVLNSSIDDALTAFLAVLDEVSLADIIKPEKELMALLGLGTT